MSTFNAAQTYKDMAIKTASGKNIIIMLYEKAIQNLEEAQDILKEHGFRGYDRVNDKITKTQKIITELSVALDKKVAPKFCENLESLYLFFNRELTEANFKKDETKIKNVCTMLEDLLSSWKVAVKTPQRTPANDIRRGINVKR